MCIFNDLSGGDKYPSLIVRFTDGRERVIKNVSFYYAGGDFLRVYARDKKDPILLDNVQYVRQSYYKYKIVKGKAVIC